jgi:CRP/FNR family transcriptional regulator
MNFENCFPIWDKLTEDQKSLIKNSLVEKHIAKKTIIHNGSNDCAGLFLIKSGQLRAYITSDEGREITLYRLFDFDICLFSASCMLNSIQFDIIIESEKDTDLWMIPADIYKKVMEESAAAANYTNELMASRFSDVMWLIERSCGRVSINA